MSAADLIGPTHAAAPSAKSRGEDNTGKNKTYETYSRAIPATKPLFVIAVLLLFPFPFPFPPSPLPSRSAAPHTWSARLTKQAPLSSPPPPPLPLLAPLLADS